MKLLKKFASKKLLVVIIGILASVASSRGFVIPVGMQGDIADMVMAFLAAQGSVDAVKAYKASDTVESETAEAAKTRKYIKKAKPREVK